MLGVVAVVTLGKAASATILLDASFICIALAAVIFLGYVLAGLCKGPADRFTSSAGARNACERPA